MRNRLIQLKNDSVVYGIGGLLGKSLSFFAIPIYTRIFDPSEYGIFEMLVVVNGILGSVLLLGLDSAQSFYFNKFKKTGLQSQAVLVSSILQLRLFWGLLIITISTFLSPMINSYLFDEQLSLKYFVFSFITTLLLQIMGQSIEILRLLYRPWHYVLISTFSSLVGVILSLYYVMFIHRDILGFVMGPMISAMLFVFIGWMTIRRYISFNGLHTPLWKDLIKFGLPLMPASLIFYAITTMDRVFIQHFHGPYELGLFSIAARISLVFGILVEVFRKAWWPIAMDSMQGEDGPGTFRLIADVYVTIGSIGLILMTTMSPHIFHWIIDEQYYGSWRLIGILTWQSFFYGYILIGTAGIWKSEKTYYQLLLSLAAFVIGVCLNFSLVPSFGGIGAAIATAVTYFIWSTLSVAVSEKLWRINIPWQNHLTQLALAIIYLMIFLIFSEDISIWYQLISLSIACAIIFSFRNSSWTDIRSGEKR